MNLIGCRCFLCCFLCMLLTSNCWSFSRLSSTTSRRFLFTMTSSSSSLVTTVDVYPLSHRDKLNGHVKTVHIVRHAQGTHNVKKEYKDIRHLDARLTDFGKQQCAELASRTPSLVSKDAVVVSSIMTRCIQTSLHSFPHLERFLAHENIRETVNYACDRRRVLSDIQSDHGDEVDFSHVNDHEDAIWNHYDDLLGKEHDGTRESAQLYKVAERGRDFLQWLQARDEEEVVVCSHEAFLRCILNWGQKGGVPLMPEQHLDDRGEEAEDVPLFRYAADDDGFEKYMRSGFNNCELRSFLMAFPSQT